MKRGNLIVISAASGTGKGTICQKLFEKKDNVIFSVSMTTRKPRPGEKHGKDYYFVSKEEFEGTIADSGFLEYAKVFNNFYGTPKGAVTENLKAGKGARDRHDGVVPARRRRARRTRSLKEPEPS